MTSQNQWLISPAVAPLLDDVQRQLANNDNILRIVKKLRKQVAAPQSALIIELAQLRIRAGAKFSKAGSMFFTTKGYEQSTSENIARYKASCFPQNERVMDVCCGIGGDLIGFAEGRQVVGVDIDEINCQYATKNVAVYDGKDAKVVQADALNVDWSSFKAVHIDPDRRAASRTINPAGFKPNLEEILDRLRNRFGAIKIAPASKLPPDLRRHAHREWIGERRECKQQIVWSNNPARKPGSRTATIVHRDGTISQVSNDERDEEAPRICCESIGSFLYEPHAAVLSARLTDSLAVHLNAARIEPGIAYLTNSTLVRHPMVSAFEILSVESAEVRRLSAVLRSHQVGIVEWKKRGVESQAVDALRRIRLKGSEQVTVIVTPYHGQIAAFVCRRLPITDTSV